MRPRHELITAPAVEPITLASLLTALRLEAGSLDEEAWAIATAARQAIEEYSGRALITQTREVRLEQFPLGGGPIYLPRAPVSAVTSFTYLDADDATQTLTEDTDFFLDTSDHQPATVVPDDDGWPVNLAWKHDGRDRVFVRYTCGYGADPDKVPARIRAAVLMLARVWFDTPGAALPDSLRFLIGSFSIPND